MQPHAAMTHYCACSFSVASPSIDKFTGKERDTESGLDNFEVRYYASNAGRFVTPDEFWKDGHPSDPQSWNLSGC